MTISTIRRATDEDYAAIERAAQKFALRHGITRNYDGESWEIAVEFAADPGFDPYDFLARKLRRLWIGCYCRALGHRRDHRLTIGSGYVGIRVQ